MSVDIEALLLAAGLAPMTYVTTPVFTGSVSFSAGSIRALGLWIGYDPLDGNLYHGEVWGHPRPNRFSTSQKAGLAAAAVWYVEVEGVEIA